MNTDRDKFLTEAMGEYICDGCGALFRRYKSEVTKSRKRGSKFLYCSVVCRSKGYTIDKDGYVLVMAKDHPNCNSIGFVREHRLVIENHIGRLLTSEEVVHHINGICDDNRLVNLEVINSHSDHHKLHANKRERDCYGKFTTHYPRNTQ